MCRSSILALTLALVSSPAHQVAAQSSEAPILPAIRAAMRKCVDDREVAGAVTLVAAGDQIVHTDAVGKADLEANRPMSSDQLFWIASMTKPITGAAVMMMQGEHSKRIGRLEWGFSPFERLG